MFELQFSKVATFKNDLLSGLTVALALVPEAVAFAFVAGVDPLVGLYAAFMVGLITACIGGRPGMISGATGALAVVMVALVADHGVEYLFMTVVLMGLLQITAGVFKLGKFIRMVPYPVMLGFVNGLAIVIFLAQLGQFGDAGQPGWLAGTFYAGLYCRCCLVKGRRALHANKPCTGHNAHHSFITEIYQGITFLAGCYCCGHRSSDGSRFEYQGSGRYSLD